LRIEEGMERQTLNRPSVQAPQDSAPILRNPQSAIRNPQLRIFCLTLAALLLASGCSLLGNKRDAELTDYEAMRRDVNGAPAVSQIEQVEYTEPAPEEEGNGLLSSLAPSSVAKSVRKVFGKEPNPKEAQRLLAEAEEKYRQALQATGDERKPLFAEAAGLYARAAAQWPESSLEQNALFLAGEGYFFADHYPDANEQYELLLKKYPNARQLDTVEARRFAMAQYWLQVHQTRQETFLAVNLLDEKRPWRDSFGNAVRLHDRIRLDDPTGRLADDAALARANAYFLRGDWEQADDAYTDLRRTFPSSEHQFKAHFLGLQCKLRTYQGPAYDGTALEECERLIKTIRKQFPQQAEEEREYLARAWAEVRYKLAEREWSLAQYYDYRREYGGARFHYQEILENYDDTPFAERTRQRLEQVADEPDVPPQQLPWLVSLFPSTKQARVRPLLQTDVPARR
jgi:outer membrane protein assembly factor BamD (BamD/ComL family)